MAITVRLDPQARSIFSKMAKEAGLGVHDLAEIACYNLIAPYVKEHGTEVAPDIHAPVTDSTPKPSDPTE